MSRVDPVILPSARKHGITDEDIMYVYDNPKRRIVISEDSKMLIGNDTLGRLLEICVAESDKGIRIIHAMKARSKYRRLRKWQ